MAYLIAEEFNNWSGSTSPDGVWQKSDWFAVANNDMDPSREIVSNGVLNLTSTPSDGPLQGGEIQTTQGYGYGLYETSMKVSSADAGVASFFLYGNNTGNGSPEFDIEFLLNDGPNQVHLANHPLPGEKIIPLGFDPTAAFHTYGINWIPGPTAGTATVQDFVDGVMVASQTSSSFLPPPGGDLIMMNAWSGIDGFGGGPPSSDATTQYDWVHFTPLGASSPPPVEPPPPQGDGGQMIVGTSGDDILTSTAGTDILIGGRGHDTFVFNAGQANNDTIADFKDNGRNSDQLEFHGYGDGSFTQIDATHWAIGYEGDAHPAEVITVFGHVSLNDFHFLT